MESLTNNIINTGRDDDHEIDSSLETEAISCSFAQSSPADSYVAHLSCIHSYLVAAYLIGILLLTPSPIVKAYLLAWMKMLTQILTSLTHRLLTPLIIMWKMSLLN